ncbi:MAG: HD domain-containing protein [Acidobacteria bacterium]|nr:MAG: HD domain-containing protein [Acidobacteriota bacterium]REJ99251.1 MAG: HD domain-containing protein [Acidobacteriota bacterium]REK16028.1 MAG: HD domain-containing protein [Acidobacteriota bacterium]REK43709.1 MAG: HD domain-containing protein [Acidobacteriota bacterium]
MVSIRKPERSLLILRTGTPGDSRLVDFFSVRYHCEASDIGPDEFSGIADDRFGVILADITDGPLRAESLVTSLRDSLVRSEVIVLASETDRDDAIECFRAGAFDLITKPFELDYLESSIGRAFEKFENGLIATHYQTGLEDLLADRSAALDKALEDIENSYRVTLKALVQALETRDFETHGHSERVVTFSLRLGLELGLSRDAIRDLELGALLHDIGKIGVPDAILRKPSQLNEQEWEKMKLHPVHGFRILRNIPFLSGAAKVVSQHHERWDGNGYPNGIKGEAIDMGARIFSVIDAFDAMISDRIYRRGRSYEDALAELEACAGSQFDPVVVEAFKNVPREDWEYLRERSVKDKQEVFSFQAIVEDLVRSKREVELVH